MAKQWREFIVITLLYVGFMISQFVGMGDFVFSDDFNMRDGSIYWSLVVGFVFTAIIFFGNTYFLIPRYLSVGNYLAYGIQLIVLMLSATLVEELIDAQLARLFDLPEQLSTLFNPSVMGLRRNISPPTWIANLMVLVISFVYRFTRDWMNHEKTRRSLVQEKLNAELAFLKNQISPHLLFNTLNGIFALARKNKDYQVADALQKLSEILRFMLYDNGASRIQLAKEIDLIENLIVLQQLRQDENELLVNFEVEGNTMGTDIAPMLLIPLVENAFKFGVNSKGSSAIDLNIMVENEVLTFRVKNGIYRKKLSITEPDSGIGLDNVRKRLDLIYKGRYDLVVNSNPENYEVLLKIDF